MNAEYPANPMTPGAQPHPGVSGAVPPGDGGPAAQQQWPHVVAHSQPPAGGGAGHPQRPAAPHAPAAAQPASSPQQQTPSPTPQSQTPASSPQQQTPASAAQPSAQHTTTQHTTTQHTTTQHTTGQQATGQQATGQGPVRRASLRTGQHPTGDDAEGDGEKKRFGGFARRGEGGDKKKGGPRRVRVMISAVDPWSAMKMSFLLAIAAGVSLVVAVSVIWSVLNSMGVFTAIQDQVTTLFGEDTELDILQYFEYNKVMSIGVIVAVVNTALITALGTIGALIYNVVSKMVGGVYATLTDD